MHVYTPKKKYIAEFCTLFMIRPCLGRGSGDERLPVLPLVEAVLSTVVCTQLPVELEMVVLHQLAQDVQELIKADLVVLVFVSCPEQLCDVVWLPAAQGVHEARHTIQEQSFQLLQGQGLLVPFPGSIVMEAVYDLEEGVLYWCVWHD